MDWSSMKWSAGLAVIVIGVVVGLSLLVVVGLSLHSSSSVDKPPEAYYRSDLKDLQQQQYEAYVDPNRYILPYTYCYAIFPIESNVDGRSTECFNRYLRPGRIEHRLDQDHLTQEALGVVYTGCFSGHDSGEVRCTRARNRWLRKHPIGN